MSVAWPEKMITQAEAFAKAANWPVYAELDSLGHLAEDDMDIVLRCGKCHQSTGQLYHASTTYNGSLDEMLSMVLRHMVMAHDVPLNTRPRPTTTEPDIDQQVAVATNTRPRMQDNWPSDGSTHGD